MSYLDNLDPRYDSRTTRVCSAGFWCVTKIIFQIHSKSEEDIELLFLTCEMLVTGLHRKHWTSRCWPFEVARCVRPSGQSLLASMSQTSALKILFWNLKRLHLCPLHRSPSMPCRRSRRNDLTSVIIVNSFPAPRLHRAYLFSLRPH